MSAWEFIVMEAKEWAFAACIAAGAAASGVLVLFYLDRSHKKK